MDIEKRLKKVKKAYLSTEPSSGFIKNGWQDLQDKIREAELFRKKQSFFYLPPLIMGTLMIFILAGVVGASYNSLPGEVLYPLRRASENVVSKVSGNTLNKVEGRANDIVELSKRGRDSESIQKAVEEYKTAVTELNRSDSNSEEIEKQLDSNLKSFEEIKSGPGEAEINQAIEISRNGKSEDQPEEQQVEEDNKGNQDEIETEEEKVEDEKAETEEEDTDRSGSNSDE